MSLAATAIVVALCLLVEGFHSGSEIAMYSVDRLGLRHRADRGSRPAALALKFADRTDLLLGTTLVGTNVATVTASVAVTVYMVGRFGDVGEALAVLVFAPLTLLFGELIPKSVYQKHADIIAPVIAVPLYAVSRVFYPIGWVLTRIVRTVIKAFGADLDLKAPLLTREDLSQVLDRRSDESDILAEEENMVRRILEFRETSVAQAMKPLVEVHAFEENLTVSAALEKIAEDRFSRYPVFHDRITKITGLVNAIDLLYSPDGGKPLKELATQAMYVPETVRIEEVFPRMQREGQHMAIAVDEYGGAVGIVTLEDILEEIVGEIEDEYDRPENLIQRVDDTHFTFKGRVEIDRVNESLGLDLPKGEYETLAGFLIHRLGRIPPTATRVAYRDYTFVVTRATDRAIEDVYLIIEKRGKGK